jgi:hypothetical protein
MKYTYICKKIQAQQAILKSTLEEHNSGNSDSTLEVYERMNVSRCQDLLPLQ